jgi:hypothetical protein
LWGFLLNKPDFSRAATEEVLSTNFRSHTRDSRKTIRATDYASAQHKPTEGDGQTISPTPCERLMLAQRALNATRLNHRHASTRQPLHTIHTTVSKLRLSKTFVRAACVNNRCALAFSLNPFSVRLLRRDFSKNV